MSNTIHGSTSLRDEVIRVLQKNYFTVAFNLIQNHIDIFSKFNVDDKDLQSYPSYLFEFEEALYGFKNDLFNKYQDGKVMKETYDRYLSRIEVLNRLKDDVSKKVFLIRIEN